MSLGTCRINMVDPFCCVYKVMADSELPRRISRVKRKETVLVLILSRLLLSFARRRVAKKVTARLMVAVEGRHSATLAELAQARRDRESARAMVRAVIHGALILFLADVHGGDRIIGRHCDSALQQLWKIYLPGTVRAADRFQRHNDL